MLIKIIIALALFYIAAMIAIYFAQALFIYAPNIPTRELSSTPADIGLAFEEVTLRTADNEKLHGWFIPAVSTNNQLEKTVLFMHGNAGNISHRLETIRFYHQLGLNFFIFDYRGYGQSTGNTSEAGTYLDAAAAWDYLIGEQNMDAEQIIIAGRSLGGGIASELANNVTPAMLILESTFTSMPDASKKHYPFMPISIILKHRYETLNKLKNISCPIVIVHSRNDEVIPFSHAEINFERANQPKKFIELRGGHGNGFLLSKRDYVAGLQDALQTML